MIRVHPDTGASVFGRGAGITFVGPDGARREICPRGIQACWNGDLVWVTECHDLAQQDRDANWWQVYFDAKTNALKPFADANGEVLPGSDCQRAGSTLRAWQKPDGVHDSAHRFFPGAALADVSWDNILILKPDYQAESGLAIYYPEDQPGQPTHAIATDWLLMDATGGLHVRLVDGVLASTEGGKTVIRRIARDRAVDYFDTEWRKVVQRNEPVRCWGVVVIDGVPWVREQNDNDWALRLTLRPFHSTAGVVLATGVGFVPMATRLTNGRMLWRRCTGIGEGPDELEGGDIVLGALVDLDALSQPSAPAIDLDTIPALNRPIHLGVEYAAADEGTVSWGYHSPQRTGTMAVLEGVTPVHLDDPSQGSWLDLVPTSQLLHGIFDTPKDYPGYTDASQATARRRRVAWLRYWDAPTYQDGTGRYVAGVQAYLASGDESPAAAAERIEREVKRIGAQNRQVELIWEAYDGDGKHPRWAVVVLLILMVGVVNRNPCVVGLIGFGKLRPTGWWPDLIAVWKRIVAKMPAGALPVLEVQPLEDTPPADPVEPHDTPETTETHDTADTGDTHQPVKPESHGGTSKTDVAVGIALSAPLWLPKAWAGAKKLGRGVKRLFGWKPKS